MTAPTFRILDIVPGTSVDGPGLRTSIYFAGCLHRCPGCHNPDSWDFHGGIEMTLDEILNVITENGFNVTFSGGDPLYLLPGLTDLAKAITNHGLNIWLYTGYTFDDALSLKGFSELAPYIDVVVDGPFIESQKDISLRFRGSTNQRIIDLKATAKSGTITLWAD